MTLLADIPKLREMEQRCKKDLRIATIEPHISSGFRGMSPKEYGATVVDTSDSIGAFGEDVAAFAALTEAERCVMLTKLAPAMIEVLECFREGDADTIQEIINGLRYAMKRAVPIDPGNMAQLLERLHRAAELMEGKE